jgi:polysaccharide export outer membrane protein
MTLFAHRRNWLLAAVLVAVPGAALAQSAAAPTGPTGTSGTFVPPAFVNVPPTGDKKPVLEAPQTPAQVAEDYRIGPGDKLRISVYKDPVSSLDSIQVRPDGKITMPLVGDIDTVGKTPAELTDVITTKLKDYINNPSVTVIVLEATASVAYVLGEVNHSGSVPLQGSMTVLQAIAMAGGLRDFAKQGDIRILRKGPNGQQTVKFNYKDAVKGQGSNPFLRPGDIVVVPASSW